MVYTFFGDRLEEDIRHEATHALLHVAIGDIPLWLDEGLAEFFEGPPERNGVNPEHVDRLPADLNGGWSPDLARLESLRGVRQMTPRDYRESWAWVHYLLNDGPIPRAALLAYLHDLKVAPDARPISARLEGPTTSSMLTHLARVKDNADRLGRRHQRPDGPAPERPGRKPAPVSSPGRPNVEGSSAGFRDLFGP